MTVDWKNLLEQGYEMLEAQQYVDAVAVLSQALVAAPDEEVASCYSTRAYAFLCLQQYERAVEDCNQALEHQPLDAEAYAWRGSAWAGLKNWRKTLEDYQQAIALSPDTADEYRSFAKAHSETAVAHYQKVLTSGEGNWQTLQDKGFAHAFKGDHEEAVKCYALVLQDRPTHVDTLWLRAQSLAKLGKHADVIRDISAALKSGGTSNTEMVLARGNAFYSLEKYPAAVADFSRYLETHPDHTEALLKRGEANAGQEKWRLAERDFSALINSGVGQPDCFIARARVRAKLEQWDSAIEDATHAMELAPENPEFRLARGEILADAEQFDSAISDYDDALAINSLFTKAQVAKGWALANAGRNQEAVQAFERAIRIDPADATSHAEKGKFALHTGNPAHAIADLTKAISLTVDDRQVGEFFSTRADAQIGLKRWALALEDIDAAISRSKSSPSLRVKRSLVAANLEKWEAAFTDLDIAEDQLARKGDKGSALGQEIAAKRTQYSQQLLDTTPPDEESKAEEHCGWALAAAFSGDLKQAVQSFTKALELDPRSEKARIGRANCLSKGGKPDAAVSELTKILKIQPAQIEARLHRAAVLASKNFSEKAIADYSAVLKVDSGRVDARLHRADLLRRLNRHSEAADDYQIVLRQIDRPDIRMQRGRSLSAAGRHAAAVSELTLVLHEDPQNVDALRARAQSCMATKKFAEAAEDFAQLLELSPMLVEAHAGQGMALARQGKYKAGLIALTKSLGNIHRDLAFAELFVTRGKVYYMMGQFELALADYERAIGLQPPGLDKVAVHIGAGLAQIHLQNRPAAEPHLAQAGKHNPTAPLIAKLLKYVRRETKELPPEATAPQIVPLRQPKQLRPRTTKSQPDPAWDVDALWDQWIVADPGGAEFGPVTKSTLDGWVAKGRLDGKCQLLRMDWEQWTAAEEVYPELVLEAHRSANRPLLINPAIRPPLDSQPEAESELEEKDNDGDDNPFSRFEFQLSGV